MTEKPTRTNRKYTEEFIKETVKLALSSPSISGTAKSLGIPEGTLHTWIKSRSGIKTKKNKKSDDVKLEKNYLLEENRRLNKELARLQQEKEILKKAAAYFAQELS